MRFRKAVWQRSHAEAVANGRRTVVQVGEDRTWRGPAWGELQLAGGVDDGLARAAAETIPAIVRTVVTLLVAVELAVTAMGRQLALWGATAVGAVENAVVALLRAVDHAVLAVGREDAALNGDGSRNQRGWRLSTGQETLASPGS